VVRESKRGASRHVAKEKVGAQDLGKELFAMAIAKVIEISTASDKSFDDAVRRGIARASETVQDIRGAWIKEQQVRVENGRISEYRVDMKVTFLLHGKT
jgi:hypothetical protein